MSAIFRRGDRPVALSQEQAMPRAPLERAAILQAVSASLAAGEGLDAACQRAGVSPATYARWSARHADAGLDGLCDLPRSGRPPCVTLSQDESDYLRRSYLRSNLRDGAGSMTVAARLAARDEASPLSAAARTAILKPRASKHLLPVEVRRALRASEAEVRRYRDPKSGTNDGLFTPGWLRMSADGTRRLLPGERQVWDDASVNVGVVVPWTRGGDKCSDRWGFRVARFQLLAGIDCATDHCVGYNFVMRANDSYNASDVVSSLWRVWSLSSYAPDECVMEGGSWQAARTSSFLSASGVRLISAKGRPNQKLIESWFNRLWTVMSITLPPSGQVGRFRGEMKAENDLWRRCREGVADPRDHFPLLTDFLASLDRSIAHLNTEPVESRLYGVWTPSLAYAPRLSVSIPDSSLILHPSSLSRGHSMPAGLRPFALPVREVRKVNRLGMLSVTAECPFGWPSVYHFSSDEAYPYVGAPVTVSFDPSDIAAGAVLELAADFRDRKAGTVIDLAAPCVSPAPVLTHLHDRWHVDCLDPRAAARAEKRSSRAKVGHQVAVFDTRGVAARHAEHEAVQQYGFAAAAPAIPEPAPRSPVDWAALEASAGVMVS